MNLSRKKALASVRAFLPNDKCIASIINLCDLYPVNDSWRHWTDHLGNFIKIHNTKRVVSFTNDPIDHKDMIVTDIYFKATPVKISSLSKWAFISFGKDQTHSFNSLYIWFLGRDDRLRFLSYNNGKWLKNEPPLVSGIDTLRPVLRNLDIKGYRQSDILRIKGPIAMDITKSWATVWPPPDGVVEEMGLFNEQLSNIIQELIVK